MIQIDMKMPMNCINCNLSHDYVCMVTERYLDENMHGAYVEERPTWCPLKDNSAQVIQLSELYTLECGTPVFIETRRTLHPGFLAEHREWPSWTCKNDIARHEWGITSQTYVLKYWKFRLYGKTWRLWTAKPTEEQRQEVAWDG